MGNDPGGIMPSKYSGPDHRRMSANMKNIETEAGHLMTLKRFVSGATGVVAAGYGVELYYSYATITALIKSIPDKPEMMETFKPGGMVAAGQYRISTNVPVYREDEMIWNGISFFVNSDPIIDAYTNRYVFLIRRSEE
jgi:hypothetical protein